MPIVVRRRQLLLVQRQHLVFDSVFNDSKVKVGLQLLMCTIVESIIPIILLFHDSPAQVRASDLPFVWLRAFHTPVCRARDQFRASPGGL